MACLMEMSGSTWNSLRNLRKQIQQNTVYDWRKPFMVSSKLADTGIKLWMRCWRKLDSPNVQVTWQCSTCTWELTYHHIDNCTIAGSSKMLIQQYKTEMGCRFMLKDLGPAKWLLGIKITRDHEAGMITLLQLAYIKSILHKYHFEDNKPLLILMDPTARYTKDQCPKTIKEKAEMKGVPYHKAIGSLMYCTVATWLDITFPVTLLTQFVNNPGQVHWEAVKRIFRYLVGTKNWELTYRGERRGLEGFTDTDSTTQDHHHSQWCRFLAIHYCNYNRWLLQEWLSAYCKTLQYSFVIHSVTTVMLLF